MSTSQEEKKFPKVRLVRFDCIITTKEGKKKYIYIDFAPIVKKGEKLIVHDNSGNIFELFPIIHKEEIIYPKIDFELFNENEGKFSDDYKLAYWKILSDINDEIEAEEELKLSIKNYTTSQTKDLFKQQLLDVNILYPPYFIEFDEIYKDNLQDMKDISDEEKFFLRNYAFKKITRKSAFLILLYRHKDDKDFLFEFDLNNEDSIEKIYDNFNSSFKQRNTRKTK
jgi:hypothetical protein